MRSSYNGGRVLVFIDGNMGQIGYFSILANNLKDFADLIGFKDFTFQQNNDPKNTSRHENVFFSK